MSKLLVLLAIVGCSPDQPDTAGHRVGGPLSPQGGTVTSVLPTSGGGLAGGGTGGVLHLGLVTSCNPTEVLAWSGSTWACSASSSGAQSSGWFGDGVDGAIAWDCTNTRLGITPSGGVYLLSRDVYTKNATISNACTVSTNGYRYRDSGNIVMTGTGNISDDGCTGPNASGATSGTACTGRTATIFSVSASGNGGSSSNVPPNECVNGTTGGVGTSGLGGTGPTGTTGSACQGGSGGGAGNATTSVGGSSSAGGTVTVASANLIADVNDYLVAERGRTINNIVLSPGSGGGRGGVGIAGVGTSGGGGGGGGGGGWVYVAAKQITGGSIHANGGNGGTGAAGAGGGGSGGGGAGGAGGIAVCRVAVGTCPTTTANGGTGGAGASGVAGGGGGGTGGTGGVGIVHVFEPS